MMFSAFPKPTLFFDTVMSISYWEDHGSVLFTWTFFIVLFFTFLKGGFHSIYSLLLLILSLSYLLWSTQLTLYGFLVLLLSTVLFMMFFLIMSTDQKGTTVRSHRQAVWGHTVTVLFFCFGLFVLFGLFCLFDKSAISLLADSDHGKVVNGANGNLFEHVVPLSQAEVSQVSQGSQGAHTTLFSTPTLPSWITMISYSTSFWMGHLVLVGFLSWLMVSVAFLWMKVAPQTMRSAIGHTKAHWAVDTYLYGAASASLLLDLSFLFLLGTILFAVPGALKNGIARSSDTSSSSGLLTGSKWREEWERWSADIYECGITADTMSFSYQPTFLRVIILGGAFLFLDIEWIFIAVLYLVSPSVSTISLITIILFVTQALLKVFYILHLMKPQPNSYNG